MAATPKPVRKAIKKIVHAGHERAKEHSDIVHYSKHHEKSKDKRQVERLKEAHKSKSPVLHKGKVVHSMLKHSKEDMQKANAHMKKHGR